MLKDVRFHVVLCAYTKLGISAACRLASSFFLLHKKRKLLDGLTQVANRGHFDATLKREVKRLGRNGKPLGLVMLDIDYLTFQ